MKLFGQVDYRHALVGVCLTGLSGFIGNTWAKWEAAEDMRRQVEATRKDVEQFHQRLDGLPVEELKKLPGRVERIERAAEDQRDAQAEILAWTRRHR